MDVKVDAAMRWDGVVAVERKRSRRWVTVAAVVLPVLAVAVLSMWFVRAFVVPPTISIPAYSGPMTLAGVPPETADSASATNGRSSASESAPEPIREARAAAQSAAEDSSTASAAPADPAPPPVLPMVQSLALAPPMIAFSPPQPSAAIPAQEQIEPGVPIAGPIPLPPRRPRASVARSAAPVPLPPQRPGQ